MGVKPHDSIDGRVEIEWSNMWYSRANVKDEGRVLLIGDSNVRMIRSTFEKMANRPVDMFGCSYGLHDILFVKQLESFFASDQYKYDTVFIQLGHHSRINEKGEPYNEEDYETYKRDYIELIDYLTPRCNKIVLLSILYSVIPPKLFKWIPNDAARKMLNLTYSKLFVKNESYDQQVNAVKDRKNEIIANIASSKKLEFVDINKMIYDRRTSRRKRFLHVDHIHFEGKSKAYMVDVYMKYC